MDGGPLLSSQESVQQQTARASSTAETRQQLIQLLPFVSDQRDTHDCLSNCQEVGKLALDTPDAATANDKPRGFASSWSMTSNILPGHDVHSLSLAGPCIALSDESNTQIGSTPVPVHQHAGPLDLSSFNGQRQDAHSSAPVNSASQGQPRSASISALQQYINAAHFAPSLDDILHPSRADAPLEHAVPVSSFDRGTAQLHHAPSDVLESGPKVLHPMNPSSLPSASACPSNARQSPTPASQAHQATLQRLQHRAHHPVHQILNVPSAGGIPERPHTRPAAVAWPPYPESFSSAAIAASHRYHQSAPEHHLASPLTMQPPTTVDSHLHAYMSSAAAHAIPPPPAVPGLSSAATAADLHLARLSLAPPQDPANSSARLPGYLYPLPIPSQAAGVPAQSAPPNKAPDWCVVTGLMLAHGHVRAPEPAGAVSVTTMLLWPPGIRSALQAGQLCLTLDPSEPECRGSAFLPSLMFCCPHADEVTTLAPLKGVYRRDMYHGRADLPERWRMPLSWETDTGEVTVREMSGVRLVLSRHGFSLLPSAASATFLSMQSLIAVLAAPALATASASPNCLPHSGPAPTAVEATPGRLLLWEIIRSATSAATQMRAAPREPNAPTQRVVPVVDTSRGGWLQRLNHEKQKQNLSVEWHDRQLSDLTWISTLLVNGAAVNSSEPCVKKQDARDGAARAYLVAIGACE